MDFLNLQSQYCHLKPKITKAIQMVLNSGQFILGQEVAQFEKAIAKYIGAKYAIGVASGTDALLLSLMALDIRPGDEVITTAFSFIASANTISRVGAKPVFVDIKPETFNLDVSQIEAKITSKTRAIIPVHLFGQMTKMSKIMSLAKQHHLFVIEDACQAIGAEYHWPKVSLQGAPHFCKSEGRRGNPMQKAGAIGDLGCFSFFPTKNLGAYGDGGLVTTNNKKLADKIRQLRAHGEKQKYHHPVIGLNSRLDEIQAAILNVKLKYLDQWNQKRQQSAHYYSQHLKDIKYISVPETDNNFGHIFHQYTIRAKKRRQLKTYLEKAGIPTMIYYPLPLHLQPLFKNLGYKKGDFPEAEKASREVLSLPIYPELTKKDQDLIIKKVRQFYRHRIPKTD